MALLDVSPEMKGMLEEENQKVSGERCVGGCLPSLFSPGSGGSSGSSRSSSSSVAPIPRLPCGFPFLSCENHVPVREMLSVK